MLIKLVIKLEKKLKKMNSYILILLIGLFGGNSCKYNSNYLIQMAQILNDEIPGFKSTYDSMGFHIENEKPINFFVYNLIDTISNSYPAKDPVRIGKAGVFHFAPIRYEISFSHIAVI